MASIGSSVLPASALLTAPLVLNYPIALANTEYTVSIPIGAKHFCLQARAGTTLQISDTVGDSNTNFFTLRPYVPYNVDSLIGGAIINLYIRSSKPSQVIEIVYWV